MAELMLLISSDSITESSLLPKDINKKTLGAEMISSFNYITRWGFIWMEKHILFCYTIISVQFDRQWLSQNSLLIKIRSTLVSKLV